MKILQILKNRKKILGQNSRNLLFVRDEVNRHGRGIADNKLRTKEVLITHAISAPNLIATIKNQNEFKNFDWDSLPKSFVVKPVHGVQGGGIEIFYNKDKSGNWILSDGRRMSLDALKIHIQDILEGKYSIKNEPDQVFFEERIKPHMDLRNYTYKGTPDIRIVVYNKIPIMAYARFPTKESQGKANMVLGAVGTGIDLASGITTTSTYGKGNGGKGTLIEYVPGTNLRYQGLKIPYWNQLLKLAVQTIDAIGMKFGAVDFLIDDDMGPVVVEISARPGLSIQIVNREGLAWRLNKARDIKVKNISHGIRIGKDLFGGEIEEQIERISGKEVISNVMPIILTNEKMNIKTMALIDTSRRTTVIDEHTARELKLVDEEIKEGEYLISNVDIKLGSQKIDSECRVVKNKINGYKVCIGRRDLANFIIDIKKTEDLEARELIQNIQKLNPKTSIEELDRVFVDLISKLAIVPAIKPINKEEERTKFFESNLQYNPQFEYKPIKFNPDQILQQLNHLNPPDDELGKLYKDKIEEFKTQVYLIESIGLDAETFSQKSTTLFGRPEDEYIQIAKNLIQKTKEIPNDNSDKMTVESAVKNLKKLLKEYNITSEVNIKERNAPTKASIGKISGKITLSAKYTWTKDTFNGMVAHEVLTHLMRRHNAQQAKLPKIFEIGTAGYIEDEEGIANCMKYIHMEQNKMMIGALIYVGMDMALEGASFVDLYAFFARYLQPKTAFEYCFRLKRGIADTSQAGAFTKDQYFGWTIKSARFLITNPDASKYIFNAKSLYHILTKYTQPNTKQAKLLDIKKLKPLLNANLAPIQPLV